MGLRIQTNTATLAASRAMGRTQRDIEKSIKQLSSGSRFVMGGDAPADFAVSERLRAQALGQRAAMSNADNAISFVQVAEGGLNEQNNLLIRLRELSIQSASDNFGDDDRALLNVEFKQLVQEVDRIAKTTRFGSAKLLQGDQKTYEFQVGPYGTSNDVVKYESNADTTSGALGVSGLDISDKYDARDTLETLDTALTAVASQRAKFGAIQSRLESVVSNSANQVENLEAARSRMADTDVAEAASSLSRNQILAQYQAAALSAAQRYPENFLKLIG